MSSWANNQLKKLERKGSYRLLSAICFLIYRLKGRNVKSVKFIREYSVWEFHIGNDYFYSSGPGWAYDYPYLKKAFAENLGYKYMPKEGDILVDVGAGVGEEIMVFSRLAGNTGRVIAIEAHPESFKALELNCKRNGLTNVTLLNVAISDVPGYIFIEGTHNALGNKVNKEAASGSTKVEAITIEQLVDQQKLPRIDFMKVNIEGAEQLLIKGIGRAIGRIKNMAISCHDFRYEKEGNEFFKTKDMVVSFLEKNNFQYVVRDTKASMMDDYVYASPKNS